MGLLDVMDDPQFRLGMGLLGAGSARSDGAGLGQRLNEVMGGMDQWQQQKAAQKRAALQEQMFNLQLEEAKKKSADEAWQQDLARKFYKTDAPLLNLPESGAGMAANPMGGDPSQAMAARPAATPKFDFNGYAAALAERNPVQALSVMQALQKDDTPIAVAEGGSLFKKDGTLVARGIVKPVKPNSDIESYQYAVQNNGYKGTLQQFITEQKKAGASSTSVKVENKMGEGVAAQIGPMLKESYTAANGAAQQIDAAGRIIKAVDSGKIIAGPLAGTRMTVAQLGQLIGVTGKDDAETIARSRDVIRGLAEMTLQGRKQMTGQGAITESEGLLAEKATSGRIEDLTPAEIKQLAKASARAAKFMYDAHQTNLTNLEQNPNTAGLAKFYKPMPLPKFNFDGAAPAQSSSGGVINWNSLPSSDDMGR